MKTSLLPLLTGIVLGAALAPLQAAEAFPDPPGGWTYIYRGDQLQVGAAGSGFTSLDGTWSHDNASDEWDGSSIGGDFGPGSGPGGVSLLTEGTRPFIRLQSTGDPRDYGYPDPSNRKLYFGHNIANHIDPAKANTLMDTGVTLTFRGRIPTAAKAGGPLDPLHPDGQEANGIQPYPADGDGYVTSDGGKGNFVIRQGGNPAASPPVPAGAIAFSFTTFNDTPGGNPNAGRANFAGLTMNESNGNVPRTEVNYGQGTATNLVAFDPTEWRELYIVLRKDPANVGTHEAFIFWDGGLTPIVFKLTAGTGKDVEVDNFLAIGGSATPQSFALDLDWFGFKDEAVFPPGARLPPSITELLPPQNAMFYAANQGISFNVSTRMPGNTLPASGVHLEVNGQNVSSQVTLTGADADTTRTGRFTGLQPNSTYVASLIVADSGGLSSTNVFFFDTFVKADAFTVESEDYNEFSGFFVSNPTIGLLNGTTGTPNIDYFDTTPESMGAYRPDDQVDTATSGDVAREEFTALSLTDYVVNNVATGEWLNYTREFPNRVWNVHLRASSTAARTLRLDRVTSDPTGPNQTTQPAGLFPVPRTGSLNNYGYTRLADAFGTPQRVRLNGRQTVRLTALEAANDINHNFLMFVTASDTGPVLPWAQSVIPAPNATGVAPEVIVRVGLVAGDNAVNANSVTLKFNGTDVSAALTRQTTPAGVEVSYNPGGLPEGSVHTVELGYADTSGNSASRTWSFTIEGTPSEGAELSIRLEGASVVIAWDPASGILEQSTDLIGWTAIEGANSPATRPIEEGHRFYRVRR